MQRKKISSDVFEIENGIIDVNFDVFFSLIQLIRFRDDKVIKNLIGIGGKWIGLLNDPRFAYAKNALPDLRKQALQNYELKERDAVEIHRTSFVFKLMETCEGGSVFINVLVTKMILECAVRIGFHQNCKNPLIYIGISSPSQIINAMGAWIGWQNCGAGLYLDNFDSQIGCNDRWSPPLKERGTRNVKRVTMVINSMVESGHLNQGKMDFLFEEKKIPHRIVNLPEEGVFAGFSSYNSSFTIHVISFRKLRVPSSSKRIKYIAYNFNGEFPHLNYNQKTEDGEKIKPKEYYKL